MLLYGHEFSLTVFDMMVFVFVDLFAQDFLLAGIVTYFVAEVNEIDIILFMIIENVNFLRFR